jgi:hypothetical protein
MYTGGIPYNLAKAFDCISHKILVWKLSFDGIQGTA